MKELENYRVTAKDGKILFRLFYGSEALQEVFREKSILFLETLAACFTEKYAHRLLEDYEQSEDPLKRCRTASLICKVGTSLQKERELSTLVLTADFSKCGKTVYSIRNELHYSDVYKAFLPETLSHGRNRKNFFEYVKKCHKRY